MSEEEWIKKFSREPKFWFTGILEMSNKFRAHKTSPLIPTHEFSLLVPTVLIWMCYLTALSLKSVNSFVISEVQIWGTGVMVLLGQKTVVLGEEPSLLLGFPRTVRNGHAWDRTRSSVMRGLRHDASTSWQNSLSWFIMFCWKPMSI